MYLKLENVVILTTNTTSNNVNILINRNALSKDHNVCSFSIDDSAFVSLVAALAAAFVAFVALVAAALVAAALVAAALAARSAIVGGAEMVEGRVSTLAVVVPVLAILLLTTHNQVLP